MTNKQRKLVRLLDRYEKVIEKLHEPRHNRNLLYDEKAEIRYFILKLIDEEE